MRIPKHIRHLINKINNKIIDSDRYTDHYEHWYAINSYYCGCSYEQLFYRRSEMNKIITEEKVSLDKLYNKRFSNIKFTLWYLL